MRKKLVLLLLAITAGITVNSSMPTYAATKKIKVDIDKEYKSCTFDIECEESGDYTIKLISPDGDVYECSTISDTTASVNVSDVKSGTWTVKVKDKNKEKIEKVRVSVSASKTSATDIVSNISIARDIAGLKTYMKNDAIVAEWNDDSIGNVNIQVVNLDTEETIASEKVADQYFECPIDATVKNFSISIVPAASSNVDGAEAVFKYKNDNHPDATVTYPDQEQVNTDQIPVTVHLGETYGVLIYNNNSVIMDEKKLDAGDYELSIPLEADGLNAIELYIVDADGNMRSWNGEIIKDTVAPSLTLTEEYDQMQTTEETVKISGTVEDFSSLSVNGKAVTPFTDGYFEQEVTLHTGNNEIEIIALDDAGNETTYHATIIREEKKIQFHLAEQIPFFVILIGLIVLLIRKVKNSKGKKKQSAGAAFGDNGNQQDEKAVGEERTE